VKPWKKVTIISLAIVIGGLVVIRYRIATSGYHRRCFQNVAVDVDGNDPPDMTGIAAWTRLDPPDGYQYYSPDCSDGSRADSERAPSFSTVGGEADGAEQPTGNHG
jgi:hypothetical protein